MARRKGGSHRGLPSAGGAQASSFDRLWHEHSLTRTCRVRCGHAPDTLHLRPPLLAGLPRTRKELQEFPARCRKGEVATWVHFTDRYWPDFLKKRDYHSAPTLMLLWYATGFCYTYWYSFDLLDWSSNGETIFMWGVLLPFLVVAIFSRCAGTCKVDEPGYGDDDVAKPPDDKPPGPDDVVKPTRLQPQAAKEAESSFAPTI